MLPERPRRILLVKEDYDDVLYKVIEDKDGSAPNRAREVNCSHLTPFCRLSLISWWKEEICTRTTTIATTFCCCSAFHFCLMRIIPSWTSTSSQHRSSPSQHSIVVRTLTRPRIPSSQQWIPLELRTKSLLQSRTSWDLLRLLFFLKKFFEFLFESLLPWHRLASHFAMWACLHAFGERQEAVVGGLEIKKNLLENMLCVCKYIHTSDIYSIIIYSYR